MSGARCVVAWVVIAGIAVAVMIGVAGCAQSVPTIEVATRAHDFQPDTLLVPAEEPVEVVYRNQEDGAEHNIAIYTGQGGTLIASSDNIVGPDGVTELVLPPLAAGGYFVQCDIHPFMTAALIVRAAD